MLLDEKTLVATMRVYMDNGLDYVPTWLLGDLVDVLGPGVFLAALDEARRTETEVPAYAAFYDGLEAEARLAQGDEAKALDLARKALDALPKAEVLMKARVPSAFTALPRSASSSGLEGLERTILASEVRISTWRSTAEPARSCALPMSRVISAWMCGLWYSLLPWRRADSFFARGYAAA